MFIIIIEDFSCYVDIKRAVSNFNINLCNWPDTIVEPRTQCMTRTSMFWGAFGNLISTLVLTFLNVKASANNKHRMTSKQNIDLPNCTIALMDPKGNTIDYFLPVRRFRPKLLSGVRRRELWLYLDVFLEPVHNAPSSAEKSERGHFSFYFFHQPPPWMIIFVCLQQSKWLLACPWGFQILAFHLLDCNFFCAHFPWKCQHHVGEGTQSEHTSISEI